MKQITVDLKERGYTVSIGSGVLDNLPRVVSETAKPDRICILTDSNVGPLYADRTEKLLRRDDLTLHTLTVPAGEQSKSMEMLQHVCEQLLAWEFSRRDLIIALGGGVVGDLAGLAASVYMRGIRYIQLPTSLLAQIDSSIGGKTAVDLPDGKNIIGTFWQPSAVLADTDTLRTLSADILKDGLGEMVKYALLCGNTLLDRISSWKKPEDFYDSAEELVTECAQIKCGIVQRDEMESGERMLLNLGHTLGHCVESYYHYERYTHGEAVAIGLVEILRYGEAAGITETGLSHRVASLLTKLGLPVRDDADRARLYEGICRDKKGAGKEIKIVLPRSAGKMEIVTTEKRALIDKVVSLGWI